MATRSEIEAQIAAIDKRLNAGVTQVRHGDTSTTFDIAELRRRRAVLAAQLDTLDGSTQRVRHIRTYSTRGY